MNVQDVHGFVTHVRSHFTLPEVVYVGSSLGCGCGFRSVSFQNGDWPEEGIVEQGECEPPDEHLPNHQQLHDLVVSLLEADDGEEHYVELYGYWDGDEQYPTAHEEVILPSRLLDEAFWFRERGLYRIKLANNGPA